MNNLLSRTYRAPYYLFAFKKNKYICACNRHGNPVSCTGTGWQLST
jgi:hypothetical protein